MNIVRIKAIKRLSNVHIRKVMVLEDWNGSSIMAGNFELIKGSEDSLPYWLATILERRKVVKIIDNISIEDMGKILFQEKQNINVPASLAPLSKDFVSRIRFYLESLKKGNNIEDLEKYKRVLGIVNEIFKIRSRKILQLAFLNVDDQTLVNSMTEEELLIYNTIKQTIKELYGDIIGDY
ncbi:MAG: hypothetical protein QXY56_00905 [Saccharolobus sp.]